MSFCNFQFAAFKLSIASLNRWDISFRLAARTPISSFRLTSHFQVISKVVIRFATLLMLTSGLE